MKPAVDPRTLPIGVLDLSVRARNILSGMEERGVIANLGDLSALGVDRLLQEKCVGWVVVQELRVALADFGLKLGPDSHDLPQAWSLEPESYWATPRQFRADPEANLHAPIAALDIRGLTVERLREGGFTSVFDLCRLTPEGLRTILGGDEDRIGEVVSRLGSFGLGLAEERFSIRVVEAFRADPAAHLDAPVAVLDLCPGTVDLLEGAGFLSVRALCGRTVAEIRDRADLEPERADELLKMLDFHGLIATPDPDAVIAPAGPPTPRAGRRAATPTTR